MNKSVWRYVLCLGFGFISACGAANGGFGQSDQSGLIEEDPAWFADYSDMEEDLESESLDETINLTAPILLTEEDLPQLLSAKLPVNAATYDFASAFGPRLQSGESNRYDFHRGIDLAGNEGDQIFSIANGTLYKAYKSGSSSFPNGGNVVVLRHDLSAPILFHGSKVTRVYSFYFHLKSFGAAATTYLTTGKSVAVKAGDLVGLMGHTGNASFNHVHFELRVQTPCSLEYQLENPTSSCAGYGYDPHINPLPLFESGAGDYQLTLAETHPDLLVFNYSADHDHADINALVVEIYSASNPSKVLDTFEIDYNYRTGFDATQTSALDNPDLGDLLINPTPFGDGAQDGQFFYSIDPALRNAYPDLMVEAVLYNALGDEVAVASDKI